MVHAVKTYPAPQDPLHAIGRVVQFLLWLIGLLWLVFLPLGAFGIGGFGFASIGSDEACVSTPSANFPMTDEPVKVGTAYGDAMGLRPGGHVGFETFTICNEHPSPRDRATATIAETMPLAFFFGLLLMLQRVIRATGQDGLFSPRSADRTRAVGWFLIVGSMVAELIRQAMIGATLSGVIDDVSWRSTLAHWDFPYAAVFAGIGVLSLARVLGRAVTLQVEQDATI